MGSNLTSGRSRLPKKVDLDQASRVHLPAQKSQSHAVPLPPRLSDSDEVSGSDIRFSEIAPALEN